MNQKTKIFTIGFVLIFGAVLLLGAGCAKKAGAPAAGGITGLFGGQLTNEDKCVELMAHSLLAPSYGQNMTALQVLQQKIDNLKKQYGWSDENIQNYCKPFLTQEGFMERVGKRMQEVLSEIK